MKRSVEDLGVVDPRGRVDVLLFKGAEYLVRGIEQSQGLSGVWDGIAPHISSLIVSNLSGIEIPGEVKSILGILQANYTTPIKKEK